MAGNMPTYEPCDAPCPVLRLVWTWWLGAGGGVRAREGSAARPIFAPRLGASALTTIASASEYHLVLVGPWLTAETQLDGVLGEGGLAVVVAPRDPDGKLEFGARLGGGYGLDSAGRAPLVSATMTIGRRAASVLSLCPSGRPMFGFQFATGAQLFATARTSPEGRGITVVAGVEVEPSVFFRTIDWERQGGNGGCKSEDEEK